MFYFLIFELLASGSIAGSILWKRKFSEMLPLTCMFIALSLYVFGLLGFLRTGVFILVISLTLLNLCSFGVLLLRKRNFKEFISNFFSPGFFIFLIFFILSSVCTSKLVASSWDEFSHWVDSVKAMTDIDDFITNPLSFSAFQSYPPIMALFQYFFQVLHQILHPGSIFQENLVFFAYQIFALSLFFPFFKHFSFRKPFQIFLSSILCLVPTLFYYDFFNTAYIDPFVGLIAGIAFARILLEKNKDIFYHVFVCFAVPVCILAKDVGLFFALFVCLAYASDLFLSTIPSSKKRYPKLFLTAGIPFVLAFLAKFSWNSEIIRNNVEESFSAPFKISSYFSAFFLHNDTTYWQTVVDNFKNAFFENRFPIGNTELSISYFNLTIILGALLLFIYSLITQLPHFLNRKKSTATILVLLFIQLIIYDFSLGATYISKFSEYEAVKLASYERYLNIAYLSAFTVVILVIFYYLTQKVFKNAYALQIAFATALICIAPMHNVFDFLEQDCVRDAIEIRVPYENLKEQISQNCTGNSKIAFISQANAGFDFWVSKFNARPNELVRLSGWSSWSLGPAFFEGDIWSEDLSLEEFQKDVSEQDIEFLAIYQTNSYFNETYAPLFENPNDIAGNTLFRYNKEKELFELCPQS